MKDSCKNGHLYTSENTYIRPSSHRRECRKCKSDSQSRRAFSGNREEVIQRDKERCVECGLTRLEHRRKYGCDLSIDHIDGLGRYAPVSKRNNSLDNLRTMCLSCHGKKDIQRRKPFSKATIDAIRKAAQRPRKVNRKERLVVAN